MRVMSLSSSVSSKLAWLVILGSTKYVTGCMANSGVWDAELAVINLALQVCAWHPCLHRRQREGSSGDNACGLKDTARQRAVIRPSTTICSFSAYARASRGVKAMSMSVLAPGASKRCPPETDRCSLLSYLHHMRCTGKHLFLTIHGSWAS